MRAKKRILSMLVSVCLIVGMLPQTAFATEGTTIGTSGLCEHHTAHDETCGYVEGTEGTPCAHAHTEDCYEKITSCTHIHAEDCYPVMDSGVSDNSATPSDAAWPICGHECSEENGCITEELNCVHTEHDDTCGYIAEVEAHPCHYECAVCAAQALIDALPDEVTAENADAVAVCLDAIDLAKAELTEQELDLTKYTAAARMMAELGEGEAAALEAGQQDIGDPVTDYDVWVGGKQFRSDYLTIQGDKGSATLSVDGDTYTLTLDGYEFVGMGHNVVSEDEMAVICSYQSLDIVLNGENAVTQQSDEAESSYGIYVNGDLSVSGDGSLTAKGGKAETLSAGVFSGGEIYISRDLAGLSAQGGSAAQASYGMYAEGSMSLDGGMINAAGGAVTGEDGESYGVRAGADFAAQDKVHLNASGETQWGKVGGLVSIGEAFSEGGGAYHYYVEPTMTATYATLLGENHCDVNKDIHETTHYLFCYCEEGMASHLSVTAPHTYMYIQNGDYVDEVCTLCGKSYWITLIAPDSPVYNGQAHEVIVAPAGYPNPSGAKLVYSYTTDNTLDSSGLPVDAGDVVASMTFTEDEFGTSATARVRYTIARADGAGSVTIESWKYGEPPNTPVLSSTTNGTDNVTYRYTSAAGYDSSTPPTEEGEYTLTVTFAETVNYNACTAECIFNIEKADLGHTHSYGTDWRSDSSGHWHQCACGDKVDFSAHTPGAAATETTPQTCTVCGYVIQAATGGGGIDYEEPQVNPDTGGDTPTEETPKRPDTGDNTPAYVTYTVQKGDTLWAIANKYGCTVSEIVAANSDLIKNPNLIYAGWQLKIPQVGAIGTDTTPDAILPEDKKTGVYIVKQGDTLWAISKKYCCTVAEIVALNGELITDPDLIFAGWELKIPQD